MGGDLCGRGTGPMLLREMRLNLLTTGTGGVEVGLGVPSDFGLTAFPSINLVAQRRQPGRELGAVDGSGVLLRLVELPRLHGPDVAVGRFREVEEDDVGVQLRGGVAIDRPRAVMVEPRRRPAPGRLGGAGGPGAGA